MNRRKFILGLGVTTTAGTLAVGSGAFTSVEADRAMSVEINDDTEAYLNAQPLDEDGNPVDDKGPEPVAQNAPYAVIDEDTGRLVLTFDSLNDDAETVISGVFQVANEGTQEVGIFFEKEGDNTGAVDLFANNEDLSIEDEPIVGQSEAIRIGVGESLDIDVEFDTHDVSSEDNIMDTLVINGDAGVGTQ